MFVGITGGIGSGKSTVANLLRSQGYPVLSADQFARDITEPGSAALVEIKGIFGPQTILANGSMNRAFLREQIMHSPELKKKLESIMHPLIQQRTQEASAALFRCGVNLVFYEAPLLFEAQAHTNLDAIICVYAKDELRIERVMKRDKVSQEAAEKFLLTQMSQKEKMDKSQYLIENNASEKELEIKTMAVLDSIKEKLTS